MRRSQQPFTDGPFAHSALIDRQPAGLTRGKYRCIMADPPWLHKPYSAKGFTRRSPSHHYRTMTIDQIKALPVGELADTNCFLFLWTTWPHLEQAFDVIRSWGFRYSSGFCTWVKLNPKAVDKLLLTERDFHMGTGYTSRKNTELLLLARREAIHRTQKPVALLEYLVRTYTNPGDLVLDNCMGSGSTGLACRQAGRGFIGIEKDEAIFAAAKQRLEAMALERLL